MLAEIDACGTVLRVAGIAVAVAGDPCRDADIPADLVPPDGVWTRETLEYAAFVINVAAVEAAFCEP
jgi:hypothetical protein